MVAIDADILRKMIGGAAVVLAYGIFVWRMVKSNPGDRFIQCVSVTLMAFVVTMAVHRTRYFPDWVLESLQVLLFLLTFLSIFFGLQQAYRALRRRSRR